jgi:transcriptional regulator GlxA family with amidase domain
MKISASLLMCLSVMAAVEATAPAQSPEASKSATAPRTRNVAIIVHQDVELLDFAGPGEVFAAAASRGGGPSGHRWFNVYTVAPTAGTIVSQGFLKIEPQYTIENCPKPDILVIPGGDTRRLVDDESFMAWVRDTTKDREITLTVCTGAFVPANLGMLDGKDATTHWSAINGLRTEAAKANVKENVRFVDNGSIITTAGVSAGIDGSLHVVGKLLGRTVAEQTARYMEYEWHPDPKVLASYPTTNPQLGGRDTAMATAEILRNEEKWPEAIAAYQAIIKENPNDADAWYQLGYCQHASGELDTAIETHKKAASFGDRAQRPLYNLACAYALKGKADEAFDTLTKAIDAGFRNPAFLENDSDWATLKDDPRFKAAVERLRAGG